MYRLYGRATGNLQKGLIPNTCLPELLLPVPLFPRQAISNPRLCKRPSNTHRQVWLSLLWGHCSFPLAPGVHKILCPPRVSVSPSLVGVLESNPLSFKVGFPGESLCQIPWLESLMWGLELSQQCEQFFSIIVIFFGIICYGWSYIIISSM